MYSTTGDHKVVKCEIHRKSVSYFQNSQKHFFGYYIFKCHPQNVPTLLNMFFK